MFKINPDPTFKVDVEIPLHGSKKPGKLGFTFKHRTLTQLKELTNRFKDMSDPEAVLEIAEGWDAKEEFNKENIEILLENYIGAATAIIDTYIAEHKQAKIKN